MQQYGGRFTRICFDIKLRCLDPPVFDEIACFLEHIGQCYFSIIVVAISRNSSITVFVVDVVSVITVISGSSSSIVNRQGVFPRLEHGLYF